MHCRTFIFALATWVLAWLPGAGFAQSSNLTLDVSAEIPRLCFLYSVTTMRLSPKSAAFGSGLDAQAHALLRYRCSNGTTPASISFEPTDGGTGRLLGDGNGNTMAYSLSVSELAQGTGFTKLNEKPVDIVGTLAASVFQNAPIGTYSDSVVLTINF